MARPREFDTTEALNRAMEVFWSQGYEGTSTADLVRAMGISKSSLYDTFGSKHELFLAAIDHYNATVTGKVQAACGIDAPARCVIEGMFQRAIDRVCCPEGRRGCFLNNCAVEVAVHDPAAAMRVKGGLAVMEETLHSLVRRGQTEGTVGADKDARALARFLAATLQGMLVMGKACEDQPMLRDVADIALAALD